MSSPIASIAAPTVYCAIAVERRNRGCARKTGREIGGGTFLVRNGFSQPGRCKFCTGNETFFFHASNKSATFQPAGETAPEPQIKILSVAFTRIFEKQAMHLRRRNQMNWKAQFQFSFLSVGEQFEISPPG